jgi:uncharacterized membrane protein
MNKIKYIIILSFFYSKLFTQDFTIDSIISEMMVLKQGDVKVVENIYVNFTKSKHGIYRTLPFIYSHDGKRYKTDIKDIFVDDNKYVTTKTDGSVKIRIGDADVFVSDHQKYTLRYTVQGPFIDSKDFQEFYWNMVGTDWPTSIGYAKCKITFEEDFTASDMDIYTGSYKTRNKAAFISKENNVVEAYTSKSLEPNEGFTIAIKLPAGYVNENNVMKVQIPKPKPAPIPLPRQLPWAGFVLLPVVFLYYLRFKLKSQEEKYNEKIIPKPYPPLDLTPAEVGTFYDNIVHDRDVISLIPYWGEQGFLRLEFDRSIEETYIFKIKELEGERPPYEYRLFNAIFSYGNSVPLSTIKNTFHNEHSTVKSMIKNELKGLAMYDENYSYWFKSWRMILISLIFIPIMILSFSKGYLLVGFLSIIALVATIILTTLAYKLTPKGQRVNQDLKGFYTFLKSKEEYNFSEILTHDNRYFEKVFPYAVAFGLDKNFMRRISPYQTSGPIWYGMYGMPATTYPMQDFSETFSPKEITSAFNSLPETSTNGSGFSGDGGFSGGGFGGGGGGSW